ncbi:tetratricopeptide repeat protein [Georgenia sp. Z1344]|uniref:co-chaperone YbbN n=1 Tax=Georgenia sp. Z1344 TaxID=3416706 RepID=UPI003CE8FB52
MSQPSLYGAVDLSALAAPAAPAGGGAAPATDPNGLVVDLTEELLGEVVQRSQELPVLVAILSARAQGSDDLRATLETLVREQGGRVQLAVVDGDAQPRIAQALQVSQVPSVVALMGGRPMPLFTGNPPADQLRPVMSEILTVAEQNGLTGRLPVGEGDEAPAEPEPEPLPPLHAEGVAAIERGDLDAAAEAYRKALAQNPKDAEAISALAQVSLARRLAEVEDPQEAVAAGNAEGAGVDAQLVAADVEIVSGDATAAFGRLVGVVRRTAGDERETVRKRLLELFDVQGTADPEVAKARRLLASALY